MLAGFTAQGIFVLPTVPYEPKPTIINVGVLKEALRNSIETLLYPRGFPGETNAKSLHVVQEFVHGLCTTSSCHLLGPPGRWRQ